MPLIPYVIEKSGREERAMDIYSRLLKDRIVLLGSGVNDEVANSLVAQLLATYCIGQAASMGAVLLAAGAAGKRHALPNARIMIHQPSAGMEGTAEDIMIHATEYRKTKEKLNRILAEHTGQTMDQIEKHTDRDHFMSSAEAQEYRIIDRVISKMGGQ